MKTSLYTHETVAW